MWRRLPAGSHAHRRTKKEEFGPQRGSEARNGVCEREPSSHIRLSLPLLVSCPLSSPMEQTRCQQTSQRDCRAASERTQGRDANRRWHVNYSFPVGAPFPLDETSSPSAARPPHGFRTRSATPFLRGFPRICTQSFLLLVVFWPPTSTEELIHL